jgi:MFS family permease
VDIKARVSVRPSSNDLWFLAYLPLAVSDGIATPLIPLLALEHFGASAFVVTIIIAASAMSQVPFTILWGNLSDRVPHRKYFLVGSFLATGVAIILIALAHNILTFFWLNVAEGLASAASAPIGTMLLLETRHKRWWPQDIGLFGLISGIGTTVGLALGFVWLFVIGREQAILSAMTALLLCAGALAILSAFIAAAWIEEPAARVERRSVAELVNLTRSPGDPLPRREYIFLAALGIMTVGFDVFYGPFPVFLAKTLQMGNASVFIVYLAASAASTALFFHSGKVVEWASPKLVFLQSLGARALLILLFVWGPIYVLFGLGSPLLVGYVSLLNAGLGVTWAFISTASTMFLIRIVGRAARGRALGLYNAIAGAGGLFGTLLGGFLFTDYGWHFTYLVAGVTVVFGMAILAPIPYHMFSLPNATPRRRHWRSVRALGFRPPRGP